MTHLVYIAAKFTHAPTQKLVLRGNGSNKPYTRPHLLPSLEKANNALTLVKGLLGVLDQMRA